MSANLALMVQVTFIRFAHSYIIRYAVLPLRDYSSDKITVQLFSQVYRFKTFSYKSQA